MKAKFGFMNDTKNNVVIEVQSADIEPWERKEMKVIEPCTFEVFEYEIPDGAFPYLKMWANDRALLSWNK